MTRRRRTCGHGDNLGLAQDCPVSSDHEPEDVAGSDVRSRAVGSVGWVALGTWTSRLASLAVFAILGRLLEPGDFGLLALAAVFIAASTVIVEGGFNRALVQRRSVTKAHSDTAFWTSLATALFMAALLIAAAPLLERGLAAPGLAPVLMGLSAALPLSALAGVPTALLERRFMFKALAIRRFVSAVAGAGAGVGVALLGYGVWALVAQWITTSAVGVVIVWRSTEWRPSFEFSSAAWRDLWSFARHSFGIGLLQLVNAEADKLLVGAFLGPTKLGYYYMASRVLILLSEVLNGVIGQVSLTTFSRLQNDLPRLRRALDSATFVSACFAFPIIGIAAALAGDLIPLLFGPQWDQSVPVMQVLAPSFALLSITYFDQSLYLGAGKPRVALGLSLTQTLAGLLFVSVALPYGPVAVAASRTLRQLSLWPVRLVLLRRHIGVRVGRYTARLIAPLGATLVAILPLVAYQRSEVRIDEPAVAVLVLSATGGAVFLTLLLLFGGRSLAEAVALILGPQRAAATQRVLIRLDMTSRVMRKSQSPPAQGSTRSRPP